MKRIHKKKNPINMNNNIKNCLTNFQDRSLRSLKIIKKNINIIQHQ